MGGEVRGAVEGLAREGLEGEGLAVEGEAEVEVAVG